MNSMKCKFSLLKYKFSYNTNFSIFPKKSFTLKINKFADVSSQVKVAPIKIPSDFYQEEKHGRDNTPPKAGEIYPIPLVESKLLALEQGYLKVWDRDPVSAFYTMKVKGKNYHVFNAARIVRKIELFIKKKFLYTSIMFYRKFINIVTHFFKNS
jgi:hypothetical protein